MEEGFATMTPTEANADSSPPARHIPHYKDDLMPLMTISQPHRLGREEATRRLKEKHAEIKEKNTYTVTDLTETWITPDSMEFAFKVLGFSLTGSVESRDDQVNISVDLPVAAMMIKGTIESQIQKELQQVLS